MGEKRYTWGSEWGNLEEKDHLENQRIDEKIVIK